MQKKYSLFEDDDSNGSAFFCVDDDYENEDAACCFYDWCDIEGMVLLWLDIPSKPTPADGWMDGEYVEPKLAPLHCFHK